MNIKPVINSILGTIKKNNRPYKLISKTTNIDIKNSRHLAKRISLDTASTADVVVIAKSTNEQMQKKITTFRDKQGKPVEIVFEYLGFNLPTVHKLFKKIETFSPTQGRLIQTFEDLNPTGKIKAWGKTESEKQFVKNLPLDNDFAVSIVKVSTKERKLGEAKTETHSFKRYFSPFQGKCLEPKALEMQIEKDNYGIPHITNITHSKNVVVPQNDDFLVFRAYDYADIRRPITQFALRKNKLLNLGIGVNTSYTLPNNIAGDFSYRTGDIQFNYKTTSKHDVIDTAFHEAHHALQYAIMSLFEKIQTAYGRKCFEKFRCFRSPELRQKADKYFIAHLDYTTKDREQYLHNLLEVESREVAHNAVLDYISKGRNFASEFNIPILVI